MLLRRYHEAEEATEKVADEAEVPTEAPADEAPEPKEAPKKSTRKGKKWRLKQ